MVSVYLWKNLLQKKTICTKFFSEFSEWRTSQPIAASFELFADKLTYLWWLYLKSHSTIECKHKATSPRDFFTRVYKETLPSPWAFSIIISGSLYFYNYINTFLTFYSIDNFVITSQLSARISSLAKSWSWSYPFHSFLFLILLISHNPLLCLNTFLFSFSPFPLNFFPCLHFHCIPLHIGYQPKIHLRQPASFKLEVKPLFSEYSKLCFSLCLAIKSKMCEFYIPFFFHRVKKIFLFITDFSFFHVLFLGSS